MKEIQIKDNATGLKVLINGKPDIRRIPNELADACIAGLDRQITEDANPSFIFEFNIKRNTIAQILFADFIDK